MNRRRQISPGAKLANQLRDYAVPIIWLILVLAIIYNVFSWAEPSEQGTNTDTESTGTDLSNKLSLEFDASATKAEVEYSGWSKDELGDKKELYPGEKLIIETGDITLQSDDGILMKLNKNGELKYDSNGNFILSSSDLFVKTSDALNTNLRFLDVVLSPWSIVSLSQNDVASTVNVLSGSADVTSIAGKKLKIPSWERITISSVETTKQEHELYAEKIGNYFFSETWALDNDLISYLDTWSDSTESGTGTTSSGSTNEKSDGYISFVDLEDNKSFGSSSINIKWKILDDDVAKITFNAKEASIDLVSQDYELNNFSIPLKENDIVYKVYDNTGNVLKKDVMTVYYQEWLAVSQAENTTTEVEFPVTDSNPQFAFTAPTPNPYTSSESFITIRWKASAGSAASVQVNGLQLKSFNGTTWRYHASTQFWTLRNGVNLYKVNYFDAAGKIVHTNTFTIIRKAPPAPVTTTTPPAATSTTPAVDTSDSWADTIGNRIPLE